jgi:D-3-phosphoglycerate dehydrogenase
MNRFTVFRPITSSAFRADYIDEERKCCEDLGFKYYFQEKPETNNSVIILSNSNLKFEHVKDQLKQTKLIIHANSGFDNLLPFADQLENIPVILGNEIRVEAVAEFYLRCLLTTPRPWREDWDEKRIFNRKLLNEMKALIIGMGPIGINTKIKLEAFGTTVESVDPYAESTYKKLSDAPIESFDIVILATSLNPTSKHIVNSAVFNRMKNTVIFLNAARAEVVNTPDLIYFLKHNPTASAFIDVYDVEPWTESPFPNLNVYQSSHIAGVSLTLQLRQLHFIKKTLEQFRALTLELFIKQNKMKLLNERKTKEGFYI